MARGDDEGTGRETSHLDRRPQLFARRGKSIVAAPQEDVDVAGRYRDCTDKGPVIDGRRLTILARKRAYQRGEQIRVVHVVETTRPGDVLYVAGPKPVHGEYVDGGLKTPLPAADADPLVPLDYDGPTIASPAVDYNYDVTTYVFAKPGVHEISWRLGDLASNTLTIEVTDAA